MEDTLRLSRSGWVASDITHDGLFLDYHGRESKRGQSVIRYVDGTVGYDWPEIVPVAVKAKVKAILNEMACWDGRTVDIDGTEYPLLHMPLWWQMTGRSYTTTGYGRKIPTEHMVRIGSKLHRIYCCIYSNIGTNYIVRNGVGIDNSTNIVH
jgi:hypothetical protein